MRKRDELIKAMGEKVIDVLFDTKTYDNYYFGHVHANPCDMYERCRVEAHRFVYFVYNHNGAECGIDCNVWWNGDKTNVECIIEDRHNKQNGRSKTLANIENLITIYVEDHLNTKALLNALMDDYYDSNDGDDEFQRNGFRDYQDYLAWKYR